MRVANDHFLVKEEAGLHPFDFLQRKHRFSGDVYHGLEGPAPLTDYHERPPRQPIAWSPRQHLLLGRLVECNQGVETGQADDLFFHQRGEDHLVLRRRERIQRMPYRVRRRHLADPARNDDARQGGSHRFHHHSRPPVDKRLARSRKLGVFLVGPNSCP